MQGLAALVVSPPSRPGLRHVAKQAASRPMAFWAAVFLSVSAAGAVAVVWSVPNHDRVDGQELFSQATKTQKG